LNGNRLGRLFESRRNINGQLFQPQTINGHLSKILNGMELFEEFKAADDQLINGLSSGILRFGIVASTSLNGGNRLWPESK
jgi:hypothetical protein